ncbi:MULTISPECIES: hypothetical protein [unclassified Cupriavidus]|uniref:hypothetical protein n=1 Tax=unclassified Cupriavidus TaxID=2640874 RepID=UPI00313B45CB
MKYEYTFMDIVEGEPDTATMLLQITTDVPVPHLDKGNMVRPKNGPAAYIVDRVSMNLDRLGEGVIGIAVFVVR